MTELKKQGIVRGNYERKYHDGRRGGVAESIGRLASMATVDAEPTGLYFDTPWSIPSGYRGFNSPSTVGSNSDTVG
jgi:hypothetical protein